MHYIVFDLEWNIAGHANKVDPAVKAAIPFEIIEIGNFTGCVSSQCEA